MTGDVANVLWCLGYTLLSFLHIWNMLLKYVHTKFEGCLNSYEIGNLICVIILHLGCYQKTYKPIKTSQNWWKLVETGQNWSKLVKTGWNWSKLSKLVETCNGLPCSKTNRTFIWTFLNLIFLLSDTSNHGWHSMFYESLIILNISTLNFSEGVLASVLIQGLLNRWTSQLDLGNTSGWLERVVSVHNST